MMTSRMELIKSNPSKEFLEGMKAELMFEINFLNDWRGFNPNRLRRKIRDLQMCLQLISENEKQITLEIT